jgi:hypothetical protein
MSLWENGRSPEEGAYTMSRTVYRKPRTRGKSRLYHADVNCYVLRRHDKRIEHIPGKNRKLKSSTEEFAAQFWEPCKVCC